MFGEVDKIARFELIMPRFAHASLVQQWGLFALRDALVPVGLDLLKGDQHLGVAWRASMMEALVPVVVADDVNASGVDFLFFHKRSETLSTCTTPNIVSTWP